MLPDAVKAYFENTGDFTYAIKDGMEAVASAVVDSARQYAFEPALATIGD